MPLTRHTERHFTASEIVRDVVIGMSDGLTVPFALAAGLSGAVAQASIVVTAGRAVIAGAYIAGGMIPLAPYMLVSGASTALVVSVCVTIVALAIFGFVKGR